MRVYHVTKSEKHVRSILSDMVIKLGRNISSNVRLAHVSTSKELVSGWYLDAIGCGRNAYILTLEIDNATVLVDDPSGDYAEWKVSHSEIKIVRVLSIDAVSNPVYSF